MSKNEYRRAFIMLRPAMTGVSGHVRLERRTMTGSMYFIVTGPGEGWQAALVGQRGRETYAAALGALKRDGRGQLTLAWTFDPRNIGGRPLEAYQLIAVARTDAEACDVALTGNVDGAYPMDPEAVREAVCALYRAETPAADLPAPEEPLPEPAVSAGADDLPTERIPETEPEPAPEPLPKPGPLPEPEPEPEPARTKIYTRMRAPSPVTPEPEPVEQAPLTEPTVEAGWCVHADASRATPCVMPLEDGYTYIRLPLPAACGMDYCLLGVRTEDNRVRSVRCAVPGAYSPAPPEGLAGSVWVSAGDGSGAGYWVFTVPCEIDT